MRVHLADVGGVPDPFHSRIPSRARAFRNGETGSGGGAPETEEEKPEEEDEGEEEEEKPEENPTAELEKLRRTNKRRETALRKAQEENAKLRAEKDKPEGDDPLKKANARLLNSSARTVLAAAGITEKDDQKLILSMVNLSDVEIDDEDGPDEDAIEEKISELRRIFGGTTKPQRPGSTTPRGVKAPDRGKGEQADPDAARYRRIIAGR